MVFAREPKEYVKRDGEGNKKRNVGSKLMEINNSFVSRKILGVKEEIEWFGQPRQMEFGGMGMC